MRCASTAEVLVPLVLERRFGPAWLARWRAVADPTARWLAICLAAEVDTGRYGAREEAAAALLARGWARPPGLPLAEADLPQLLATLRAAGLWPGTGRGGDQGR